MTFLTHFISGLSLGSVYAIIALGYTMVYGIAKMLNFAHGDVIMVGAYIAFCSTAYLHMPAWLAVIAAMLFCTCLGIIIERLAYKPAPRRVVACRAYYGDRRFIFPSERSTHNMGECT